MVGFSGFPTSGEAESKSSKTSKAGSERQVQGASRRTSNKMAGGNSMRFNPGKMVDFRVIHGD